MDPTENMEGELTLMSFLTSIFTRLNKIFAQLTLYFEALTESVGNILG